jgi:hypothetical protein
MMISSLKKKGGVMKKFIFLAALMISVTTLTGCVNRASAKVDQDTDLRALKNMHVVKIPDETAGISTLIADDLRRRGYNVTEGTDKPKDVNAIVTYADRWMWDITMYLLELTISIREPKTDFPVATGNSMHGSLTRMSPKEMVDEIMGNIFKEVK